MHNPSRPDREEPVFKARAWVRICGPTARRIATGYLVALIESVCIREMLHHLDPTTEVIVGRAVNIQHSAPAAPRKQVWLRGWTMRMGERSTTFTVQVFDDHEAICDGSVTLVAASRTALQDRLARKS